jgi:hypothetical protein
MMRALALALAMALGLLSATAGCDEIFGIGDRTLLTGSDGGDATTVDVAPQEAQAADAATRDVVSAAPACLGAAPPGRPATDDPSDAGDQSFVVAVHTLDLGYGYDAGVDGGLRLGWNLDSVYTCCEGGAESCNAAVAGTTHCDDPAGRDNATSLLIGGLAGADRGQFDPQMLTQGLQAGTYSILLQMQHYNGQANDTQVHAALYVSNGVEGDAGGLWNGSDHWTIDDKFVLDAGTLTPNHVDPHAYVASGTLVVHIDFPITTGTGTTNTFTVLLTGGLITGQIVPAGNGTYRLAGGNFAGRWNVSEILTAVQTFVIGGTPVCPGALYYSLIKQEVCQYADIMTNPAQDNTGVTCDALSAGLGFTADPAVLGSVTSVPATGSSCGPTPPDDCTHP